MAEANSICVVPDCGRPIQNKTLGYCDPHYKRHWRHGDIQAHIPIPPKRNAPQPVQETTDGLRKCQACGEWKALDTYHLDPSSPRGRKTACRTCRQAVERARHDPELNAARCRAYRAAHLDELRAKGAARYDRDRESHIATATANTHIRRARLATTPNDRGVTITSLRKRDGDDCHYCGVTMTFARFAKGQRPANMATLEHMVPVSRGGAHSWTNCVIACWRCNISKSNRLPSEFTSAQ